MTKSASWRWRRQRETDSTLRTRWQYQAPRGFTPAEAEEAIRTMPWLPAERGRLEVRKDFSFAGTWNGRFFQTKQVRPIFVEEADEIVVVTVYTYYF